MSLQEFTTAVSPSNSTTPVCDNHNSSTLGFVTAAIAVVGYGTTFVSVKKYKTGDGMFFQWMFGLSTGLYALVIQQIRGNPKFYLLPMLGGAIFTSGNITRVPVVRMIGLGLAFASSGIFNLLSGWATGRFGLFGLDKDPLDNLLLNDVGVILAIMSAVVFATVKNEVSIAGIDKTVTVTVDEVDDTQRLIPLHAQSVNSENDDRSFIDELSPTVKRVAGVLLSTLAGICYGQLFTPYIYVRNHYEGSSQNGLDYVFSTLCGSVITSTVYFLIYAAYKRNRPRIYPRVIIPAFVSGLVWTVATASCFVANVILSEAIVFPIITTGPIVVANLLGVFIFKEIKGARNLLILTFGIMLVITSALFTGFSKKSNHC